MLHNDGPRTEIEYRLVGKDVPRGMGALDTRACGLERDGRPPDDVEEEVTRRHHEYRLSLRQSRQERKRAARKQAIEEAAGEEGGTRLREELLDLYRNFLQIDSNILRGAFFLRLDSRAQTSQDVAATKASTESASTAFAGQLPGLLPVQALPRQCSRWRSPRLPWAMAGRGDRGLLITTGTFTAEAKQEATRDGAPPIDLIDGSALCDLLRSTRWACGLRFARSRTSSSIQSSSQI